MKGFIILLLIISNFNSIYAMIGRRASLLTPRVSCFIDLRFRRCFVSSVMQCASDSSVVEIGNADMVFKERAKRKIALTLAFVGSNYHGLQLDLHSGVPTVEAEVESALYKLGCINESNHLDLTKISWSRSSRTDKRVHCARLVISAKLEIPLDWLSETEVRIPPLVEHMNQILPPDIRLLSVCKINQSFRAREACSWREYEYVMPKSFLYSKSSPSETGNTSTERTAEAAEEERSAIEIFKKTLKRMEGNMSFHNFHRVSAKNLKRREFAPPGEEEENSRYNSGNKNKQSNQDTTPEGTDHLEQIDMQQQQHYEAEAAAAAESSLSSDNAPTAEDEPLNDDLQNLAPRSDISADDDEGASTESFNHHFFDGWEPVHREQNDMTRGVIFAFEIIEDEGCSLGDDYIRIRIRGQSFMLHQIRLMIAAAALTSRKVLPETAMDMALLSPYFINLPLAPAEGLIVVNSGFERNGNGQSIHLYKDGAMESTKDMPFSLMTKEEFQFSVQYKNDSIYPKIKEDWERDDSSLVSKWETVTERYRVSDEILAGWETMLVSIRENNELSQGIRRARETARLIGNIKSFQRDFMSGEGGEMPEEISNANKGRGPGASLLKSKGGRDGGRGGKGGRGGGRGGGGGKREWNPFIPLMVGHAKLLPNGLSTALITRFRVMPEDVSGVQRALATMMVNDLLDVTMSAEELVDYVVSNGGFDYYANVAEKHDRIT